MKWSPQNLAAAALIFSILSLGWVGYGRFISSHLITTRMISVTGPDGEPRIILSAAVDGAPSITMQDPRHSTVIDVSISPLGLASISMRGTQGGGGPRLSIRMGSGGEPEVLIVNEDGQQYRVDLHRQQP